MNKYFRKQVVVLGTEVDFLKAVKEFLLSNTLIPFTLESENLTNTDGEANYLNFTSEDYKLEIISFITNTSSERVDLNVKIYKNNEEKTLLLDSHPNYVVDRARTREYIATRRYHFLFVVGDNLNFFYIGSAPTPYANATNFLRLYTPETGYVYTSPTFQPSSEIEFTHYTYPEYKYWLIPHTFTGPMSELILSNFLDIKVKKGGSYAGKLDGCCSLGGGVEGKFYRDENNILIFCFGSNACFKLEEEVSW